jgi:hypothetical protein
MRWTWKVLFVKLLYAEQFEMSWPRYNTLILDETDLLLYKSRRLSNGDCHLLRISVFGNGARRAYLLFRTESTGASIFEVPVSLLLRSFGSVLSSSLSGEDNAVGRTGTHHSRALERIG